MANDDGRKKSPGGSTLLHHKARERGWSAPRVDVGRHEAIEAHLAQYVGRPQVVWHEVLSDLVHLDVHVVAPTEARNMWTLFTTGMSDLPMNSPAGALNRAELMISLPAEWQHGREAYEDERWYWPVRLLKMLARLPHEYDTWLFIDHTIPNGQPAVEYAPGAGFAGSIIFPPMSVPPQAGVAPILGEQTMFLGVYPIYPDEMDFKLQRGGEALMDIFQERGITELLQPGRPSVLS